MRAGLASPGQVPPCVDVDGIADEGRLVELEDDDDEAGVVDAAAAVDGGPGAAVGAAGRLPGGPSWMMWSSRTLSPSSSACATISRCMAP